MHRIAAVFLVGVLSFAPVVEAQDQDGPQFGVALGVNLTTLDGRGDLGVRGMATGGVVMTMDLGWRVAAQPQLLLSQKGTTVKGENGSIRYGAGYVEMPVVLRLNGPSIGSVTPYVLGGGFGSVKVYEQQRAGGDLGFPLNSGTSFFRRTDAGLAGGVGGRIPIGDGRRLNLVVRYEHGLAHISREVEEQPYPNVPFPPEAQTRTWALLLRFGV